MKKLLVLSVFISLATLLMVTSCSDEELINEQISFEEQLRLDKMEYEAYVSVHGEVTIEKVTLEELQAFLSEHNMPLVNQEFIDLYYKNLKSLEKATGPCSSGWINYCGDLSQNGVFSLQDLVIFDQTCDIVCTCSYDLCSSWDLPSMYRRFGYLSYYDPSVTETDTDLNYNAHDYYAGLAMLTYVLTC